MSKEIEKGYKDSLMVTDRLPVGRRPALVEQSVLKTGKQLESLAEGQEGFIHLWRIV